MYVCHILSQKVLNYGWDSGQKMDSGYLSHHPIILWARDRKYVYIQQMGAIHFNCPTPMHMAYMYNTKWMMVNGHSGSIVLIEILFMTWALNMIDIIIRIYFVPDF